MASPVTIDPSVDWGTTGATVYYRVLNAAGGTVVARTNANVTESPAGSGQYHVNGGITVDAELRLRITWDDGTDFPTESLDPYVAAAKVSVGGLSAQAKADVTAAVPAGQTAPSPSDIAAAILVNGTKIDGDKLNALAAVKPDVKPRVDASGFVTTNNPSIEVPA